MEDLNSYLAFLYVLVLITSFSRWYKYSRLVQKAASAKTQGFPTVSVLIAVKNEEGKIEKCLTSILQQNYSSFDIIVVDDHSTDKTLNNCRALAQLNDRLHVISLPDTQEGKKSAIAAGILFSKSEWILMTDADCQPASEQWIETMMGSNDHYDVIVGVSPYRLEDNSWLSSLIAYEGAMIALDYLSAIDEGKTYMAVGRNLALRRETFLATNGFAGHEDLASGSDDLLVQSIRRQARITYIVDEQSLVWTTPKRTWAAYLQQKKRHMTTSWRYDFATKWRLATQHLAHAGFYVLPIYLSIACSNSSFFWCMILGLAIKGIILRQAFSRWQLAGLNWRISYLDLSLLIFYVILAASKPLKRDVW